VVIGVCGCCLRVWCRTPTTRNAASQVPCVGRCLPGASASRTSLNLSATSASVSLSTPTPWDSADTWTQRLWPKLHIFCFCGLPGSYNTINTIFLADRTNGRAIGTLLRPSVCLSSSFCRLSVTLCIVAKRCVPEQKLLLLRAYRKSYMRNRLVPK